MVYTIRKINLTHNHEISPIIFNTIYPKNRIPAELANADLKRIVQLEPKPKKLKLMLEADYGVSLTQKDISNLVFKHKAEPKSTNQSLKSILDKFSEKNYVRTSFLDNGELSSIFIQLEEMAVRYRSFPRLLLVDSTYKINNLNWPLLSFVGVDRDGEGRLLAVALIANENHQIIDCVFGQFNELNSGGEDIEMVMTDKDSGQINLISHHFPKAKIQICLFHVIQAFNRKIQSLRLRKSNAGIVKKIFLNMLYSSSELAYFQERDSFLSQVILSKYK